MSVALLSDHVAEIRRQIEDEGWTAGIGPPLDPLRKDLGSFVLGPPPLDETRVHVDDPVLRHPLSLVQPPLHMSIGALFTAEGAEERKGGKK